jgi:hypothetical protein
MKKYWDIVKKQVTDYIKTNWNSDSYFNKGKLIFIGVTLFFVLWKLIYSLFV